jgi:GntR family transcriptional repressor for pyruvate dehydrogenase complex
MPSPLLRLTQLKSSKLSDQAMESILDQVKRGILQPGDRLPSLRELVSQLGVSQTAVREALRALVGLGVIDLQAGRGAFVQSVSSEILINPESLFFLLQRETLLHTIEVRQALEVETIALAAERATAEDLAELERILRQMERGAKSNETAFRHSPYFHLAIARATHNPVFISMVKSFVSLLKQGALLGEFVPEAREREHRLHAELYESIVKRDVNEARCRMREHLQIGKEQVLKGFRALSCVGGLDSQEPSTQAGDVS